MTANWTDLDGKRYLNAPERVCQPCARGQCQSCRGRPHGREYERWETALERLGPGCLCAEQGHPTPVTCGTSVMSSGRGARSHRCGKRVKGTIEEIGTWNREKYTAHVCGLHLSAHNRRIAAAEARVAEREQTKLANDGAKQQRAAADDTAAMLNEACELLGIEIKAVASGGAGWNGPSSVNIQIDHEAAGALARFLIDRHG